MGALGVLAAAAVLLGGVQTTMVLTQDQRIAAEQTKTPVVEVQTIQSDNKQAEDSNR
jgi:hypothetical protein